MDRVKLDRAFNLAAAYSHDYWIWTFRGKVFREFGPRCVFPRVRMEIRGLNLAKRGTRMCAYYEWRSLRNLFAKSFETKMLLFVPEFLFRCTDHFEDIRIACR